MTGPAVDVEQLQGLVALQPDGDWERAGYKVMRGRSLMAETGLSRDAELIVAAVNALPALLDLIRRQDAALTAKQAVIDAVTELADRWEREGAPAQWHGAVLHATIPSGEETPA